MPHRCQRLKGKSIGFETKAAQPGRTRRDVPERPESSENPHIILRLTFQTKVSYLRFTRRGSAVPDGCEETPDTNPTTDEPVTTAPGPTGFLIIRTDPSGSASRNLACAAGAFHGAGELPSETVT